MMPSRTVCAFALSSILLVGCSASKPGFVVRDWSTNLRELGIYPMFPPREDVCVGDLFVSPVSADSQKPLSDPTGYVPIGSFHAHVNMKAELDRHYAERNRFPARTVETASGNTSSGMPLPSAGCNGGRTGDLLRQVAFPLFVRAQVNSAQLGAYLPPDVYAVAVRAGASSARSATVSVSAGESYGLPARVALEPFARHWVMMSQEPQATTKINPIELAWLRFAAAGNQDASQRLVDLTLVTELYVVRTFDVSLHASDQAGAAIDVAPASGAPATPTATSASDGANGPANKDTSTPASASSAAQALRDASLAQWRSVPSQPAPGVTAQVLAASTGDVALRATYERPIAIGYRGIRWRVNLETGEMSRSPPPGEANFHQPQSVPKTIDPAPSPAS